MKRAAYIVSVLASILACGSDPKTTSPATTITLADTASLDCASGKSPITTARLFISGDLPECDLTVTLGKVSGSCPSVPTGIDRFVVLRYGGASDTPIRYAVAIVPLKADELKGNIGKVTVTFPNDGQTGFFIDTDADVAQLATSLYGSTQTALTGAQCFARSVIAVDAHNDEVASDCLTHEDLAPVLDLDDDGCSNQRESCDGTSPSDANSRSCN